MGGHKEGSFVLSSNSSNWLKYHELKNLFMQDITFSLDHEKSIWSAKDEADNGTEKDEG